MTKILIDTATVEEVLEALERYQVKRQDFDRWADEIIALREALASEAIEKPIPATELREQEPVAWLEILRNNKTSSDEVIGAFLRGHAEYLTGEAFVITSPPAQPQQEPVAYAVYHRMGGGKSLHWPEQHSPDGDANEYQLVPLYKFPPAQRTWVHATTWRGLTDDEVMEIAFNFDVPSLVVRTVEAKLKEKNT